MIPIASIMYIILACILLFYTISCKKEDKISSLIAIVATLAIGIKFYYLPWDLNVAIVLPFIYFLPIVLSAAVLLKKGYLYLLYSVPGLIISGLYIWYVEFDIMVVIGHLFLVYPPIIITSYIVGKYKDSISIKFLLSIVIALLHIISVHFQVANIFVVSSFLLTIFFLYYAYKYSEDLRDAGTEMPKLSKFQFEVNRKLTHSFVFLVFLPEWILKYMTDTGINKGISQFLGYPINISAEVIGISYVRIGAIILLGSIYPVFILLELLRIKGNIRIVSEKLLRPSESEQIAGYVWIVAGILTIAVFFDIDVFLASTAIAFIADAFAALVGIRFGKHKITQNRSLEGTLAGFISGFLSASIFIGALRALIVAIIIAIVDILVDGYASDNIIFPLVAGISINFLKKI